MSIEQVESAILDLSPEQRRRLLVWFDEHREALFDENTASAELNDQQKAEILRRRQEYRGDSESFRRMDGKALDEMFARIRGHVAARLSSAG